MDGAHQSDLMLHEAADELIRRGGRSKGEDARAGIAVRHEPVARAPSERLPRRERLPVLKIDVHGIEIVEEHRVVPVGPVVVRAKLQLR